VQIVIDGESVLLAGGGEIIAVIAMLATVAGF
jgi:hypothetical protein